MKATLCTLELLLQGFDYLFQFYLKCLHTQIRI